MHGVIIYPSDYWLLSSGYIISYKKFLNFELWFLLLTLQEALGLIG